MEGAVLHGRNEIQGFPFRVAACGDDLAPEMGGYPFDVLHEPCGAPENIVVYPLEEIAMDHAVALFEPGGIRIVDVSTLMGMGSEKVTLESKVSDDFYEIWPHRTSAHRFFG
jgi:hypothetical protein